MTATAEAPSRKDVRALSATELELDLRRMTPKEIRTQMGMLEEGLANGEFSLNAREAMGVWHGLAYHVYTGRDTRDVGAKWDALSRRWVRAANGKPENLRAHNNALLIRGAHTGSRDWDVCLHEAAHAIVAHACGAEIEDITVSTRSGPAHVTLLENDMAYEARIMDRVAARVVLDLADIPCGRSCYSDLTEAHEIARDALGTDKKAAAKVKELRERVRDMLTTDKYRRQLLTVATALDERTSLTGAEFRWLVGA